MDKIPVGGRMLYFKLLVVVVITLLFANVWMVNRLATDGGKLDRVKQAQVKLALENQILENEIAKDSALLYSLGTASKLGFETIKNIEYFTPPAVAAAK